MSHTKARRHNEPVNKASEALCLCVRNGGFQAIGGSLTKQNYDASAITKVSAALADYRGAETGSDESDAEQVGDTASRDTLIKTINTRRSAIQHAADGQWPYTSEASVSFRKAFALPLNRPLSV